jgi:hypothetical protein
VGYRKSPSVLPVWFVEACHSTLSSRLQPTPHTRTPSTYLSSSHPLRSLEGNGLTEEAKEMLRASNAERDVPVQIDFGE